MLDVDDAGLGWCSGCDGLQFFNLPASDLRRGPHMKICRVSIVLFIADAVYGDLVRAVGQVVECERHGFYGVGGNLALIEVLIVQAIGRSDGRIVPEKR